MSDKLILREDSRGVPYDPPLEIEPREAKGHINMRTGIGYHLISIFEAIGGKKFEPWMLIPVVLLSAYGAYYFGFADYVQEGMNA